MVGPETARAATAEGRSVAFRPDGPSSAAALAEQWLATHGATPQRCLVVRSDLASATLSDDLELRGHDVRVCVAYRTVGVDLTAEVRRALMDGEIDLVLLTSLSVARELRRQVGTHLSARLAAIGPGTATDARGLGFRVDHIAARQSVRDLISELDTAADLGPAAPNAQEDA